MTRHRFKLAQCLRLNKFSARQRATYPQNFTLLFLGKFGKPRKFVVLKNFWLYSMKYTWVVFNLYVTQHDKIGLTYIHN